MQLPLPWKDGYHVDMPKSLPIAMRRLRLQSNKLAQQPELSQKYEETFENMKRNGHVESINKNESRENEQNPIHYITHFSTGQKFRVVYNSALRINGISINDMLYRGPMFLESPVGILIRFRQHAFGVPGDIRNMFFQVKLHPRDRDMLRFLPLKDQEVARNDERWRFTVMPYGIICVPSIAGFCIKYTAARNYANVSASTAKRVEKDFYVDDLITSVETVEAAKTLITEATNLLATTGFVLTKFSCNSKEVLEGIDQEHLAPQLKTINPSKDGLPQQRTLGVSWDAESDQLQLHLRKSNS